MSLSLTLPDRLVLFGQERELSQEQALRAQYDLDSMETIEKISKPCPQCKAKTERSGQSHVVIDYIEISCKIVIDEMNLGFFPGTSENSYIKPFQVYNNTH